MEPAASPQCVLLAAGGSTRLRPLTDDCPKCLLTVGGKTLIERTIENVLRAGINEIAVVTGYKSEILRDYLAKRFPARRFRFVWNPNYAATNNAYSLLLARHFLEDREGKVSRSLLLLDSDILFSAQLLPFFLQQISLDGQASETGGSRSAFLALRAAGDHDDEEIRVSLGDDGNIAGIGKSIPFADTRGESVGIEFFPVHAADRLFTVLERRVRSGEGRREFYEASFQQMIDEGMKMGAVDVSSYPVLEIDTADDLARAHRMNID